MNENKIITSIHKAETQQPLDAQWYDRFHENAAFQAYEYLIGNKEERTRQKERFINGDVDAPTLDYPRLDEFDFDGYESNLLQLKADILSQEQHDIVKNVYKWKINEKLAELRMLRATKNGDDKRFKRYAQFIYGKPEDDITGYTMDNTMSLMTNVLNNPSSSDEQKKAAQFVFDKITPIQQSKYIEPPKTTGITDTPTQNTKYDSSAMKDRFETALQKYGLEGWSVLVSDEYTAVNVGQELKEIRIPTEREVTNIQLQKLIAHEIGTHALRRQNGERSKLRLLGLGLDRSKDDEGVATYQEQKIDGAKDFSGFIGYFAIALANNPDNNFKDVFEIIKNYHIANGKTIKKAQDFAWNRCVRTFRGTSCQMPGACFTKDMVYRENNVKVLNLIKSDASAENSFMMGKYDPTNPRHIWILSQLNITKEELDNLEK